MKRFIQHISALALLAFVASCTMTDIDYIGSGAAGSTGDAITILGRVARFTDVDVTSRGVKQGDEGKITSMALAIFPVKADGSGLANDGKSVYYQYSDNQQELLFTIERDETYATNARYVMYIFTNMPGMANFGTGATLDAMLATAYSVSSLDIPTQGFPMIGSLGDTFSTKFERDDNVFILSPTQSDNSNDLTAPTVNGISQSLLTIPMKAIYAKVNFSIQVRPDQTIEGNYSPQFTFNKYTVYNVPSKVDFDNTTNSGGDVISNLSGLRVDGNIYASGANTIEFSFYLPERYLEPDTTAEEYGYPFRDDKGNIRDEDRVYMQRYKEKLIGSDSGKKATNIVIEGTYRDHQNHSYDVSYTIYLGEDNYSDFNIRRNHEYNNFVTIRGIQSSNDMSLNGEVSIDHRVNIKRTQPAIISLRRETLLDSHFEVRPLRIRSSGIDGVDHINAVKVEVLNPNTTNWMRIEHKNDDSGNSSLYLSNGKRKYFTYNLVNGRNAANTEDDITNGSLKNSTSAIVPISVDSECVWIYVDENTNDGDAVRAGVIQVTYGNLNGDTFTATTDSDYPPVKYTINQRNLFKVTYDGREYYIEYEEEYLHNFDTDDNYLDSQIPTTDNEGIVWGLDGIQLSYDHQAILIHDSGMESLTRNIRNAILNYSPYYDFYLVRDFNRSTYYFENDSQYTGIVHEHNGYNFCTEIIQLVNGGQKDSSGNAYDKDLTNDINVLQLNQQPKSAIEYCYNKNKRNANGQVATSSDASNLKWYLPAIDEIEEIMMSKYESTNSAGQTYSYYSYARFEDFQGKYYWSSQPAFYKNIFLFDRTYFTAGDRMGHYMIDNPKYARATKVLYNGGEATSASSYAVEPSGMEANTYYQYLYMVAGGSFFQAYPDVKSQIIYYVEEIVKSGFKVESDHNSTGTGNGEYFQFNWANSDSNGEITEKLYPPKYQDGYRSRTSKARVRCVRKIN